jgi:hypothetical protein
VACSSGSDTATGPGPSSPTLTLTANNNRLIGLGDIALAAEVTAGNATNVVKVEFYERVIGGDASPQKLGEDSEAPYEFTRHILSVADDGNREFTAKAYERSGVVATSNPLMVVVDLAADTATLRAMVSSSPTRITTPGRINFTVMSNKAIGRLEVYSGTIKVAEVISPAAPFTVGVAETAADNGTQAYVVKAYDLAGHVIESAPMTVEVDIRWDFVRAIEGIHSHEESPVAIDAMGSVYFAGTTQTWDVFLVKHDADGNRVWLRDFGGQDSESARSLGVDVSGRVFLTGDIFYPPNPRHDCFLTIYDADGKILWTRIVDIQGWAKGPCFAASDAIGNLYVAGNVRDSAAARVTDVFIAKYDRDGNKLFSREFASTPGAYNDEIGSVAVDPLGGVYVSGATTGSFDGTPNPGGSRELFLLKYDAEGNGVWTRQYRIAGLATAGRHLAADPEGGAYVAADTWDPKANAAYVFTTGNALLLRYGPDGTLRWARTLDGGSADGARGVAADLRNVYVVGYTSGGSSGHEISEPSQGGWDLFFAKLSRDGDILSVRLLGSPIADYGDNVAIGANGSIYVAGSTVYDAYADIRTPMLARHHDAP